MIAIVFLSKLFARSLLLQLSSKALLLVSSKVIFNCYLKVVTLLLITPNDLFVVFTRFTGTRTKMASTGVN